MTTWKRYIWSNSPQLVPLDAAGDWWNDDDVIAAGFDPNDHEVACLLLVKPWNGHPLGSRVVSENTVAGHSFAVEMTQDMMRRESHHRIMVALETMDTEEFLATMTRAGICDANGVLMPAYLQT